MYNGIYVYIYTYITKFDPHNQKISELRCMPGDGTKVAGSKLGFCLEQELQFCLYSVPSSTLVFKYLSAHAIL